MRTMWIIVVLCLMAFRCNNNSTEPKWELNTSTRTHTGMYYTIKQWNSTDQVWIETSDHAPVTIRWRFISYTKMTENYQITGGYTLDWNNPNTQTIQISITRLKFCDNSNIPMAEYDIVPADQFTLAAGSNQTRNGTFTINISNMELSDQISYMELWSSVIYL